jgi:23S rRNA pseudouridine1911/1915/1917 synthase
MVFLDGRVERRAGTLLQGTEHVLLTLELQATETPAPALRVLYRDADLLAVDKPAGLPAHPTVAGRANALDLVRTLMAEESLSGAPILLHRLDADTTGVLLFALNAAANRVLARQFVRREVEKTYLALVQGQPATAFAVENHLRAGVRGRTVVVRSGGQPASTAFRTLARGEGLALVEARPKTGRTHQIRAHLAAAGHPLLGDPLYGGPATMRLGDRSLTISRHLLHAFRLELLPPGATTRLLIEAPLPEDFHHLLQAAGLDPDRSPGLLTSTRAVVNSVATRKGR